MKAMQNFFAQIRGESIHDVARSGDLDALIRQTQGLSKEALNQPNEWGSTPLVCACTNEHHACILHLLKQGADPNTLNTLAEALSRGVIYATPLHQAAFSELKANIRILLFFKARYDIRNKYGETALDGEKHIKKMILETDKDFQQYHALIVQAATAEVAHNKPEAEKCYQQAATIMLKYGEAPDEVDCLAKFYKEKAFDCYQWLANYYEIQLRQKKPEDAGELLEKTKEIYTSLKIIGKSIGRLELTDYYNRRIEELTDQMTDNQQQEGLKPMH
jgi:tetratricopeptide (TPR) repeat protein